MAKVDAITVDCERAAPLARWWAQVLDGYDVRPYDDAEIERLASLGLTPQTDPAVMVDGPGPSLCFQEVAEKKTTKNRMHVDLAATDRRAEVDRLLELGATVHQETEEWTTMLDPEGNEFCVADAKENAI